MNGHASSPARPRSARTPSTHLRAPRGRAVRLGPAVASACAAALMIALVGCAGPAPATPETPDPSETSAATALPPAPPFTPETPFPAGQLADYQLGGAYPAAPEVRVVARDASAAPDPERYSICYLNGFQTQPGESWPRELLLRDGAGEPIADPDWPDEFYLDVSTAASRARIAERLAPLIRGCAERGYLAVEFDNLDSYTRAPGLTEDNALAHAAALVGIAHGAGLAAAQKNSPGLGTRGRDLAGFDFIVSEQCLAYDECDAYTRVYGDAVIDIEYGPVEGEGRPDGDEAGGGDGGGEDAGAADRARARLLADFQESCASPDRPAATVLRDRALSTPDSIEYVFELCGEPAGPARTPIAG